MNYRLTCNFKAAKWQSFEKENSFAGVDDKGEPLTLESWMSRDENQAAGRLLWFMLGEWAAKQDSMGKNAIGLSFKLPKGAGTFIPISFSGLICYFSTVNDTKATFGKSEKTNCRNF